MTRTTEAGWLVAAVLAIGSYAWFIQGAIVPIGTLDDLEYIIVLPAARRLLADLLIASAAVTVVHALLRRVVVGAGAASRPDASCWRPVLLLFAVWASVPAAMHPRAWWSAPVLYLSTDLAPVAAFVALGAWVIALRSLWNEERRTPNEEPSAWPDIALCAAVVGFVIATSPMLRFSSVLHGDEPKYMRFCENLYQGRGFEIGAISSIAALPPDMAPRVADDVRSAVTETAKDIRRLGGAAGAALNGDLSRLSNRARYAGAWFVEGKYGGLYQVHTPGLSFLLFPGYALDRYLLNWAPSEESDQVPARLFATDAIMLAMYGLWAVALARLLARYTSDRTLGWVVAAICFTTLPLAAFPFQIYPEIAAGLIVTIAVTSVLFEDDRSSLVKATLIGLLAAYLFWLHIRFAALSLVVVAAVLVARRRRLREQAAVAAGYVVGLGLFCLYVYHITGSILPDALYFTQGNVDPLAPTNIPRGLVAYVFDATWGLLASAPVFVLAFVGAGLMVKEHPRTAVLAAALALSLAAPSAAHSYRGAGATPLRHVVAVAPLVAFPLADAVRRYRRNRAFVAAAATLALVSTYNAARYNLFHVKEVGPFVDHSVSGWKLHLLFPTLEAGAVTWICLVGWIAVAAVLVAWPIVTRARRALPLALAAAFVGVVAGAAPLRRAAAYLPDNTSARGMLIAAAARDASIRTSSLRGYLPLRAIAGSPGTVVISADRLGLREGGATRFTIKGLTDDRVATWGRLVVDFGDRTPTVSSALVGTADLWHTYRNAGFYKVGARLELPGGAAAEGRLMVGVRGDPFHSTPQRVTTGIESLPGDVGAAGESGRLRAVRVGPVRIIADAAGHDWAGAAADMWMFRWDGRAWTDRVRLNMPPDGAPIEAITFQPGDRIAVLLSRATQAGLERTDIVEATWPDRLLRIGAPVSIVDDPEK